MPLVDGLHIDIACGYATFLAQLGWRFPRARLVGLNIDFMGPHAGAPRLLAEAGVKASLVAADARRMPFMDNTFHSASCFLGLQDIEIGFGEKGIIETMCEAVRVLRSEGMLTLIDKYAFRQYEAWISGLPLEIISKGKKELDVKWDGRVAMEAIRLYAKGWIAQMRIPSEDREAQEAALKDVLGRMEREVETQLSDKGHYVPFEPMNLVVARKTS